MKKRAFSMMLIVVLAASLLAGCGGGEKKAVRLATGGESGTYYAIGGVLGTKLNPLLKKSTLTVNTSGASKANLLSIEDGETEMAVVQSDTLAYAHEGIQLFASEGATKKSLWVAGLYNEIVQIVAKKGINSIEELKGKTVVVGDVGSGTEFNAAQVLEAYGMTFADINKQNGSFQQGVDGIIAGNVDAVFTVSGAPTTSIMSLDATNPGDFDLLSLSKEAIDYLTGKYPFLVYNPMPAGTYSSITHDTECVAVQAVLVASEDLSEDVVYELTKAMFDNLKSLGEGHDKWKLVTLEGASGNCVTMHPGALKYYKEVGAVK